MRSASKAVRNAGDAYGLTIITDTRTAGVDD
jgi:hypothetical protein